MGEPTHLKFVRYASISRYGIPCFAQLPTGNLSEEALVFRGLSSLYLGRCENGEGEPPADSNVYSEFIELHLLKTHMDCTELALVPDCSRRK